MSKRGVIREFMRSATASRGGPVSQDEVIAGTKLSRSFVQTELSHMCASGELHREDEGYTVNPDFVVVAPGQKRGPRLPNKLRGFRAEARKRKAVKRGGKGKGARTFTDLVKKHVRPSVDRAPVTIADVPPLSALARSTFAVVVALLPEIDEGDRSALRHAMDAHARVLAALV